MPAYVGKIICLPIRPSVQNVFIPFVYVSVRVFIYYLYIYTCVRLSVVCTLVSVLDSCLSIGLYARLPFVRPLVHWSIRTSVRPTECMYKCLMYVCMFVTILISNF